MRKGAPTERAQSSGAYLAAREAPVARCATCVSTALPHAPASISSAVLGARSLSSTTSSSRMCVKEASTEAFSPSSRALASSTL